MISDLKLEKYLLGELSPAETKKIEEEIRRNEILRMRIQTMQESGKDFLKKHPAADFMSKLKEIDDFQQTASIAKYGKFLQLAAAVVIVLGIASIVIFKMQPVAITENFSQEPFAASQTNSTSEVAFADTRIKGLSSRFEVWKKQGESAIQMQDKDSVTAGDELQIRYAVTEKCFGLLFSMDGNGVVTIHIGNNNEAAELDPQGMKALPFAYKLDDAPQFEKFFFVTGSEVFSLTPENIDLLLKNQNIKQTSLTLIKNMGR